jgi:two-component system, OmpR family, sensor histidine kinase SenX3
VEILLIVIVAIGGVSVMTALESQRRRLRAEVIDLKSQLASEIERTSVLARERDRIAEAFDALDDGVIVADAQGDELVRNSAARSLATSRRSGVFTDEASASLLAAALRGVPSEQELALVGPPRRVLALRAVPLWDRGRVVGAVVGIRDITEPRRVDDVRRDFVANVSHELRTPIGALAVLAETMADETDIGVMRQFAERITREADRLARIVDDLLDLSQLEGDPNVEREIADVRSLVHAAVEQVSGAAEAAHIEVRVAEIDPTLTILAERRQVVSAVFNLLDNAIKYSEPGSAVDVDVQVGERSVAVMVRDHGVGIPTRDLERIFERFYRVDRARSRETGGTGLGLSIVRHVAQAHDGEVSVISHEGEGSAFTLSFPLVNGGAFRDETPEETLR